MDEENQTIDHKVWQEKLQDSYVKANKSIDDIWSSFKLTLHGFLDMIEASMHLKELSIMLDFNEYYKLNNIRPRARINFDDVARNRDQFSDSQSLITDNSKINPNDLQGGNKLPHKSPIRNNFDIGNNLKKPGVGANNPTFNANLIINQKEIKSTRSMVQPKGNNLNYKPDANSVRMEEENDTVQSRQQSSSKNSVANNAYLRQVMANNKVNRVDKTNNNQGEN